MGSNRSSLVAVVKPASGEREINIRVILCNKVILCNIK